MPDGFVSGAGVDPNGLTFVYTVIGIRVHPGFIHYMQPFYPVEYGSENSTWFPDTACRRLFIFMEQPNMRTESGKISIAVVSHLFPTLSRPILGIFVREELDHLAEHVEIRLCAPLHNQYWFKRGWRIPETGRYPVIRPFVLAFPRWFLQHHYPASMALTLGRNRSFFEGCSLIHAHNAFPDGVAAFRAFGAEKPVVVTVHGSDVNHFAMKPALRPAIVQALNQSAGIISVSRSLAETLRSIGVNTNIDIIPNGFDPDMFSPGDRTEACVSLGLNPDRPRVLFVGNFERNKGIEYLIEAMPRVLERCHDCELVILGAEPATGDTIRYRDTIAAAGVGNAVVIAKKVPHEALPPWIRASDLLVLPSIREGFGIVLVEALACGKPVVATASGGPQDIVEDGLGVLVPPGDSGALGEGILQVLEGRGIAGSHALRDSVVRRFSFPGVIQRIVDVYRVILGKE